MHNESPQDLMNYDANPYEAYGDEEKAPRGKKRKASLAKSTQEVVRHDKRAEAPEGIRFVAEEIGLSSDLLKQLGAYMSDLEKLPALIADAEQKLAAFESMDENDRLINESRIIKLKTSIESKKIQLAEAKNSPILAEVVDAIRSLGNAPDILVNVRFDDAVITKTHAPIVVPGVYATGGSGPLPVPELPADEKWKESAQKTTEAQAEEEYHEALSRQQAFADQMSELKIPEEMIWKVYEYLLKDDKPDLSAIDREAKIAEAKAWQAEIDAEKAVSEEPAEASSKTKADWNELPPAQQERINTKIASVLETGAFSEKSALLALEQYGYPACKAIADSAKALSASLTPAELNDLASTLINAGGARYLPTFIKEVSGERVFDAYVAAELIHSGKRKVVLNNFARFDLSKLPEDVRNELESDVQNLKGHAENKSTQDASPMQPDQSTIIHQLPHYKLQRVEELRSDPDPIISNAANAEWNKRMEKEPQGRWDQPVLDKVLELIRSGNGEHVFPDSLAKFADVPEVAEYIRSTKVTWDDLTPEGKIDFQNVCKELFQEGGTYKTNDSGDEWTLAGFDDAGETVSLVRMNGDGAAETSTMPLREFYELNIDDVEVATPDTVTPEPENPVSTLATPEPEPVIAAAADLDKGPAGSKQEADLYRDVNTGDLDALRSDPDEAVRRAANAEWEARMQFARDRADQMLTRASLETVLDAIKNGSVTVDHAKSLAYFAEVPDVAKYLHEHPVAAPTVTAESISGGRLSNRQMADLIESTSGEPSGRNWATTAEEPFEIKQERRQRKNAGRTPAVSSREVSTLPSRDGVEDALSRPSPEGKERQGYPKIEDESDLSDEAKTAMFKIYQTEAVYPQTDPNGGNDVLAPLSGYRTPEGVTMLGLGEDLAAIQADLSAQEEQYVREQGTSADGDPSVLSREPKAYEATPLPDLRTIVKNRFIFAEAGKAFDALTDAEVDALFTTGGVTEDDLRFYSYVVEQDRAFKEGKAVEPISLAEMDRYAQIVSRIYSVAADFENTIPLVSGDTVPETDEELAEKNKERLAMHYEGAKRFAERYGAVSIKRMKMYGCTDEEAKLVMEQLIAEGVIDEKWRTPSAEQADSSADSDIGKAFKGLSAGLTLGLYEGLYQSLVDGSDTFAGIKDPLIAEARDAFELGEITSPEALRDYFNNKHKAKKGAKTAEVDFDPTEAETPAEAKEARSKRFNEYNEEMAAIEAEIGQGLPVERKMLYVERKFPEAMDVIRQMQNPDLTAREFSALATTFESRSGHAPVGGGLVENISWDVPNGRKITFRWGITEGGSTIEPVLAEGESVALSPEVEEAFKSALHMSDAELNEIPQLRDLSEGQQLKVLEEMKHLVLKDIEREKVKRYRGRIDELAKSDSWWEKVKGMGMKATKKFQLGRMKDEVSSEWLAADDVDAATLRKEALSGLIDKALGNKEFDVTLEEDKFVTHYLSEKDFGEDLDDATKEKIRSFNETANAYANTDLGESPEAAKEAYEAAAREMTRMLAEQKEGKWSSDNAAAWRVKLEGAVQMERFFEDNPDLDKELNKAGANIGAAISFKNLLAERGVISAASMGARYVGMSVLGLAAIPLVAAGVGGVMGWRRAKDEFSENELLAQMGDRDTSDDKEHQKTGSNEKDRAKNFVSGEKLVSKLEKLLGEYTAASDEEMIEVSARDERGHLRMRDLPDANGKSFLVEQVSKKESLRRELEARVAYTSRKMEEQLIDLGSVRGDRVEQIKNLALTLGEARAVLGFADEGINAIETRVNNMLDIREEKIEHNQMTHLVKQAMRGALMGAAISEASVVVGGMLPGHAATGSAINMKSAPSGAAGAEALPGFSHAVPPPGPQSIYPNEAVPQGGKAPLPLYEESPLSKSATGAPYSPEDGGPRSDFYGIKPGQTLTGIAKETADVMRELTPAQQNNVTENLFKMLTPEEKKLIGVTDVNRIFAGKEINIFELNRLINSKQINGESLAAHARHVFPGTPAGATAASAVEHPTGSATGNTSSAHVEAPHTGGTAEVAAVPRPSVEHVVSPAEAPKLATLSMDDRAIYEKEIGRPLTSSESNFFRQLQDLRSAGANDERMTESIDGMLFNVKNEMRTHELSATDMKNFLTEYKLEKVIEVNDAAPIPATVRPPAAVEQVRPVEAAPLSRLAPAEADALGRMINRPVAPHESEVLQSMKVFGTQQRGVPLTPIQEKTDLAAGRLIDAMKSKGSPLDKGEITAILRQYGLDKQFKVPDVGVEAAPLTPSAAHPPRGNYPEAVRAPIAAVPRPPVVAEAVVVRPPSVAEASPVPRPPATETIPVRAPKPSALYPERAGERAPISIFRMSPEQAAKHTQEIAAKWDDVAHKGPGGGTNPNWPTATNYSAEFYMNGNFIKGAVGSPEEASYQMQGLLIKARGMGFEAGKGEKAGQYLERIAKELREPLTEGALKSRSNGIFNTVARFMPTNVNTEQIQAVDVLSTKNPANMAPELLRVQEIVDRVRLNTGIAPKDGQSIKAYILFATEQQLKKTPTLHANFLILPPTTPAPAVPQSFAPSPPAANDADWRKQA